MNDRPTDSNRPPDPPSAKRPAFTPVTAKRRGGARVWRIVLALGVSAILAAATIAAVAISQFIGAVPQIPDRSALLVVNQAPGMTFEDRTGAVIATRGPKHGYPVKVAELPAYVPRAFLAAEDRRFYRHGPIDLQGIGRALRANWEAGHTVQGGSTLTQQLAKTLFLAPDQTLKRKLQEAVIAWRLEQRMSKDEILELYLNRIFFGDNAYGVDAAAQTYFGKPARNLTIQEAALLAALPKAPTRLALTNDMDAALARSRLILSTMHAEGWITAAEEQAALTSPPKLASEAPGEGDYGYVLDMAAQQAVQIAGGQAPDLIVQLSIDPVLQTTAQTEVRRAINDDGRRAGVHQGSLVLLSPDGGIRALVGGADHRLSAFNRAVQAQRQPGSSFKAFVYAAAVENGVRPSDIRTDSPVRIGLWSPSNYGGGYRGPVSVADALAHSINTIAVQLANEVGTGKVAEIAHRFGLKSIPDNPTLSIALGAYEVNLLELTSGFQVFQQGGQRIEPFLIQQISTSRGDMLYAHVASAGPQVYDIANAGIMVRMLEGVLTKGTGTRAAFGRPAAGKTGTSQNWRDAWFIGFTPDWVCGVWVGNDDDKPMNKVTGGEIPAQIWRRVMIAAHQNTPIHDFAWLPPEEPAAPTAGADVAPSGEPVDQPADARAGFYDRLSQDFDQAAGAPRLDAAPDERPPVDGEPAYRPPPAREDRGYPPPRNDRGYNDDPAYRQDRGYRGDSERPDPNE